MAVKSELKCPKCNSVEQFTVDGYIEDNVAIIKGDGFWIADLETNEAHIANDATVTCSECEYYADVSKFRA